MPGAIPLPIPIETSRNSVDFEAVFRECYPLVVRTAMRVLGNQAEAEEVAAEAFVKLLHEKRTVENSVGWLRKAVLNIAVDRLRASQRRVRREQVSTPVDPANPEEDLQKAQARAQVRHVLAELSDQEAKLLLGRADGCSYQELADLLDIKPASVGTMLARAEKRFQQKFEDCYGKQ